MSLSPSVILSVIVGYFLILILISRFTSQGADNQDFFNARRQSPWYLVAFGMIGATLSGVTFISVPGWVLDQNFAYMQMVLGYLLGYLIIGTVLMPMYYRLNLTSIYSYLEGRFGVSSYKTGAAFFILSRTIGASFRLYLIAIVLQQFVLGQYGVPFWVTVMITILLIWIYTFKGGIKTIVYTDTLQTFCMLLAVVMTILAISQNLNLNISGLISEVKNSSYSKAFYFDGGWSDPFNFFKQFLAGASIAIVMTGLDQDMMQKNLSCKNIGEAQKNMFWFSIVLVIAKFLFLFLGALLFIYAAKNNIILPERTDLVYPTIALEHLSPWIGIIFILGLIAAAYSSADSALTALTTSFCVDFLNFEKEKRDNAKEVRKMVHIGFSVLLFVVILIFYAVNNDAVISAIFKVAGYTYGPLLGLYSFGFFTKKKITDGYAPLVCILAPLLTYIISSYSEVLLWGYKFGFELLILNGLLTFIGLWLISRKND
jgi:SSS family transporter